MIKAMWLACCMFAVPCMGVASDTIVTINNTNNISVTVKIKNVRSSRNYLRDKHRSLLHKHYDRARTNYFLRHRLNNRKNYRPARSYRPYRPNVRIRRSR